MDLPLLPERTHNNKLILLVFEYLTYLTKYILKASLLTEGVGNGGTEL